MGRYIAKRLGMMLVLLIGMTFIVFGSLHLASGDPAQMVAGASATEEDIAAVRTSLGLDQPFWVQYGRYLKRLVTVDEARDTLPTPTPVPTPTPTFAPTPTISPTSAPEITLMPQSYPTLRRNDAGADVKQMQTRLIELGYLQPGGNDGDFGTGTFNAVREFQRNNNLTTDGVAGPATLSVLYGASPVPANPGGEE